MSLYKSNKGYYYLREGDKNKRISKFLFEQIGGLNVTDTRPLTDSDPAKVIYRSDNPSLRNAHVSCFKERNQIYYCHGTNENNECHYGKSSKYKVRDTAWRKAGGGCRRDSLARAIYREFKRDGNNPEEDNPEEDKTITNIFSSSVGAGAGGGAGGGAGAGAGGGAGGGAGAGAPSRDPILKQGRGDVSMHDVSMDDVPMSPDPPVQPPAPVVAPVVAPVAGLIQRYRDVPADYDSLMGASIIDDTTANSFSNASKLVNHLIYEGLILRPEYVRIIQSEHRIEIDDASISHLLQVLAPTKDAVNDIIGPYINYLTEVQKNGIKTFYS